MRPLSCHFVLLKFLLNFYINFSLIFHRFVIDFPLICHCQKIRKIKGCRLESKSMWFGKKSCSLTACFSIWICLTGHFMSASCKNSKNAGRNTVWLVRCRKLPWWPSRAGSSANSATTAVCCCVYCPLAFVSSATTGWPIRGTFCWLISSIPWGMDSSTPAWPVSPSKRHHPARLPRYRASSARPTRASVGKFNKDKTLQYLDFSIYFKIIKRVKFIRNFYFCFMLYLRYRPGHRWHHGGISLPRIRRQNHLAGLWAVLVRGRRLLRRRSVCFPREGISSGENGHDHFEWRGAGCRSLVSIVLITNSHEQSYFLPFFSGAFNGGGGVPILSPLIIFWNFFKKHKQRGDPLEIFYGPSLQTELDAPLPSLRYKSLKRNCLYKSSKSESFLPTVWLYSG